MAQTVVNTAAASLRELSEIPADRMAKADLRLSEQADWRLLLGAAIKRARVRAEWSLKEFAAKVGRDDRQVARWESGDERPQWDVLFALDDAFRQWLIVSLAELSGRSVEVETVVRIRRIT